MIIHLLSPGPSIRLFDYRPGIRVVVNRLIDDIPECKWWATGELANPSVWRQYLAHVPRPSVGIATCKENLEHVPPHLAAADLDAGAPQGAPFGAPQGAPQGAPGRRFSAPLALAWIYRRWPEAEVHAWGCDMSGAKYANGAQIYEAKRKTGVAELDEMRARQQIDERWRLERAAWVAAAAPGVAAGRPVIRHLPQGAVP